jgi:hypothetical protein
MESKENRMIRPLGVFGIGFLMLAPGCAGKRADYGEPFKLSSLSTVSADEVLANPEKYDGRFVRVSGRVDEVCAHRGCWMRLAAADADETIFVKFTCPVEGRLIPMEAAGRRAIVEGTLVVDEISEEEARHYKEDANASPEEIAKIVGPQKMVRMNSPAARILGMPKQETASQ